MDQRKHKQYTGASNNLILENARKIAQLGKPMVIRVPIITNDYVENLTTTAEFIKKELPGIQQVHLLPYEPLGESKYELLGKEYGLKGLAPPSEEALGTLAEIFSRWG